MIRRALAAVAALAVAGVAALGLLRFRSERRMASDWRALAAAGGESSRFTSQMVEGLPEPARRYLLHAIAPGTPLARSVELELSGSIRLSREGELLPMSSAEVLAPPRGYVWKARLRQGPVPISGFDLLVGARAEMRWWAAGVAPIVRASGDTLARSAAGRLVGEAIFLPSALLPPTARWEAVDSSHARVRLTAAGEEVVLTLEVDGEGRLRRVSFPRWNGDPANGPVGYLTFVSDGFEAERTFGGYRVPARFRAGWRLGEPDELPFFFATVDAARYR